MAGGSALTWGGGGGGAEAEGWGSGAALFPGHRLARLTLCSLYPQPTPIGTMHSEVQVQPPSRDKAQPHTKHQVSAARPSAAPPRSPGAGSGAASRRPTRGALGVGGGSPDCLSVPTDGGAALGMTAAGIC